MARSLLSLLTGLLCMIAGNFTAAAQQAFTLSGDIDGLQIGDTLRFQRTIMYPKWQYEEAFEILIQQANKFHYEGVQAHDQQYLMSYHPKEGAALPCDRPGQTFIVTEGDQIHLEGSSDNIYYCKLTGGLYDDPLLAKALHIEDSLGMIRGSYFRLSAEARQKQDSAAIRKYQDLLSAFDMNAQNQALKDQYYQSYVQAHPEGTLHILLKIYQFAVMLPLEKLKTYYESYSPSLQSSYYGQVFAQQIADRERLSEGQPAPDFTVTATDGRTLSLKDYRGRYILLYHWGLCPGSIAMDSSVCALYHQFKAQGFEVVGLTESIATIRHVYEQLPADQPTSLPGTDDIRPVLADMLQHPWTEVELNTQYPDNQSITETYQITARPFFILITPEGTIAARGLQSAFNKAKKILETTFE